MAKKWLVVGISGVTCGGKSSLAKGLVSAFPGSIYICQDDYFLAPESHHHVVVKELNHVNWEIMTALDMSSMRNDVKNILSQDPKSVILPRKVKDKVEALKDSATNAGNGKSFPFILILEGFLLLNDSELLELCDLCYYVTLTKAQCWERRRVRTYDPPDVPGYFDLVVWPEYTKHRDEVLSKVAVKEIDGTKSIESIVSGAVKDIQSAVCCIAKF